MTLIRPATSADTIVIHEMWMQIIRDTSVTFSSVEKTLEDIDVFIEDRQVRGRGVFVALRDDRVVGFATYDQFRSGDGYAHAMEHSIVLGPSARGQGMGRALMQAVEDHARRAGAHTMVACVSGENSAGIAFHSAIGYELCGRLPQSGRKFDRWLDLVLMQKIL